MLLRGSEKRIATLKRLPTPEESSRLYFNPACKYYPHDTFRFNISAYPHTKIALEAWKTTDKLFNPKVSFGDWTSALGERGSDLIYRIYSVSGNCAHFIIN